MSAMEGGAQGRQRESFGRVQVVTMMIFGSEILKGFVGGDPMPLSMRIPDYLIDHDGGDDVHDDLDDHDGGDRDPDDSGVSRDVQPLELVMEDTPVALSPIQVTSSSFSKNLNFLRCAVCKLYPISFSSFYSYRNVN